MHIRPFLFCAILAVSLATCAFGDPSTKGEETIKIINAGRRLPVTNVNFKGAEEFPEVAAWGSFAHDRGTRLEGIIVESKTMEPREAARRALALHHWDRADSKTREKLATAWVLKILLAFDMPLKKPTSAFAEQKQKFEPITVISRKDGGVTVRVWVQGPVGSIMGYHFYHQEYKFSPKGEVEDKAIEKFESMTNR